MEEQKLMTKFFSFFFIFCNPNPKSSLESLVLLYSIEYRTKFDKYVIYDYDMILRFL